MRRYFTNLGLSLILVAPGLLGQLSLYEPIQVPGGYPSGVNASGTMVGSTQSGLGFVLEGSAIGTFSFPGATSTNANGINNAGEIVGSAQLNGASVGFYLIGGTYTQVVFPGSADTYAYGVNNSGQIVGEYVLPNSTTNGFLFTNGTFTTIDVNIGNAVATTAYGINDAGDIVGNYTDQVDVIHGFYFAKGAFTPVDYPGAGGTTVFGINNHGQMVGYYAGGHGFLLDSGLFSTIDSPLAPCLGSSAQGINDTGEIVGVASLNCYPVTGYARNGLSFPLKGTKQGQVLNALPSPYTAPINSVFDHAMTHPYTPKQDGTVTAFTSETGLKSVSTEPNSYCYGQAGALPFYVTGHYTGGKYLCYDNHPGYDFKAAEGTEVYATLSGKIYYPTAMLGITPGQAYKLFHVMELIPDDLPTLKIYHLHLATHPACLSGTPVKGADCWPDQPVIVSNPAPGCPSVLPPPATDPAGQPTHVNAGCLIAYVGKSGAEDIGGGPHLHFEVQEVVPENATLNGYNLTCKDNLAIGNDCVPIDPYGWYPLTGNPADPYYNILGIQNVRLWFQNP